MSYSNLTAVVQQVLGFLDERVPACQAERLSR
jgi:hypothetical protein